MREANWAGTHTYGAHALHRPTSLDEVREVLARAPHVRVLGSRHAFTDLADAPELVSLEGLAADVEVDRAASTVSFAAGLHYGELATALEDEDVALHNLPSLPHVCVAGAVATATHGSGDAHGNLATAVAGLQLVTPAGDVVTAARDDEDFEGLVVGLGGLDPENCSAHSECPARGGTGCRTSASGSRRAAARSCSRSSTSRGRTLARRSRRYGVTRA